MRRLLKEDGGIAMVTSLLVMVIIASFATAGFTLAKHTLDSSGNDRRGVQAIHAAEAGIDDFMTYLSTVPTNTVSCATRTGTLPTTPSSTFSAVATFYATSSDTTALNCPSGGSLASFPGAVVIRSTGTSAGVARVMEGFYGLAGLQGGYTLYNGAVYSDGAANFSGQATMTGNPYGADLVSNGNVSLGGGGTIYGNIYAQGTLALGGGTEVKQDAISKLGLTMTGGAIIRGNARSSTQNISESNNSTIGANAYYCTGSPPSPVTGQKLQECNSALPSTKTWSQLTFTYNATDWTSNGNNYTIHTFNDPNACTNAKNYIQGSIASGDHVIRINSTCTLSYGGHDTANVKGNLAIVSNGPLDMASQSLMTSTNGQHNLYLMFNILTARPCATAGVSFNSQALIDSTLNALLYSPCVISFGAQSSTLTGQIIGGSVSFGAGSNITTVPVQIPGNNPNGFQQTMLYRREVK